MFQQATPSHPTTPNRKLSTVHGRPRDPHWRVQGRPGESRGVLGGPGGGRRRGSRGWFNNRYIQNFIFLNLGQVSGLPAPGRDPGAQTAVRAKHGSDCNGLGRERHHPTQNLFSRLWSAPWPGAPNISRKRYFPGGQGPGAQGHGPGDRGPGPARGTRGPGSGPPNISRKRYFALRAFV